MPDELDPAANSAGATGTTPPTASATTQPNTPAAPPQLSQGQLDLGAVAQDPPPDPTPATPTFLDELRSRGFELDETADEAAARARLLDAYTDRSSELARLQEEAERNRVMLAWYQAQAGQQQTTLTPTTQQPTQPGHWWAPPQVDRDLVGRYLRVGEDGEEHWIDGTPPALIESTRQYREYMDNWAQGLLYRPDQTLAPVVSQIVASEVNRILMEREIQDSDRQFNQQFPQKYQWAISRDPVTNQPQQDAQGYYKWSKDGEQAAAIVDQLMSNGLSNRQLAWEMAGRMVETQRRAAAAPAPNSSAVAAEARNNLIARGAGVPADRTGTFQRPEGGPNQPRQNQTSSPEETLRARLRESGLVRDGMLVASQN